MPSLCPGWRVARRTTPVGGTCPGPCMMFVGANAPPHPRWPLSPTSLPHSLLDNDPAPTLTPLRSRGIGPLSQYEAHIPWRRPPPAVRSKKTRLRRSWSDLGSSRVGAITQSSHQGYNISPLSSHSPQSQPYTRAVWRRGGPSAILAWGGKRLCKS